MQPGNAEYVAIHWGVGEGMLQCQVCFALVLPEPEWKRDPHMEWHRQQGHVDGEASRD